MSPAPSLHKNLTLSSRFPGASIPRPELSPTATFEHAVIRHGRAEHEWLQPETGVGGDYAQSQTRMLVLQDRCLASTEDALCQVELVICRGTGPATVDILYRLPEGSWLSVEDAWDWPLFDALSEENEQRVRIELPEGRVRLTARLEQGARLSVRLVNKQA